MGDASLDFETSGEEGPVVVQLHGLTSSRDRDAHLGLDLARALRGHRVLRYDARGHGGSSGTPRPEHYHWSRLAEDLLALLDEVAPGEQVHGIGPSMGAGTLLHAALADLDRFATLCLVVPPTAWSTRPAQRERYLADAALIEAEGVGAFVHQASTAPGPPALADAPATEPTVAEELLPTILRGAAATDLPDPEQVGRIPVPTLVLAWEDDPSHPVSTAVALGELLPVSRVVVAQTPYGLMAWPGLVAEHVAVGAGLRRG
ncbi:Beta-ketoadipate enol-lactone hydrolase [Serinicoccus hydrothermalis]|uniref:Beta-ketoadipate enol-lactone hydrolase n=1 Tax=Serinicoccus hydrothermalis TaxID=1758689 RepID=A0A1B1NEU6_9MICO|nr:Beta-ketoadipate enol-lactone hydrolase [Serinicoccus hydrothermalis]